MPSACQKPRVLRRPAVAAGDLLLHPIDVIVEEELAKGDAAGHEKRARKQHQIDQRREGDMDAGMDEAARMAIDPLVQILIGGLQIEIGDRVLEHQDRDGGEGEKSDFRHRRYFDKASAVPSQ